MKSKTVFLPGVKPDQAPPLSIIFTAFREHRTTGRRRTALVARATHVGSREKCLRIPRDGPGRKGGLVCLSMVFLFCFLEKKESGRKTDAIQKRAAYFGCIAAPDGSSAALAPAERPFSSWPASSVPPRWSRARTGGAGWRRSSAGSTRCGGRGRRQSWPSSGGASRGRRAGVLRLGSGRVIGQWAGLVGGGPASPEQHTHRRLGVFWRGRDEAGTHDGPRRLQTSCRS